MTELPQMLTRPAAPREVAVTKAANHHLLDIATLIMAAFRTEQDLSQIDAAFGEDETHFIRGLLQFGAILTPNGLPDPDEGRSFLSENRHAAILQLAQIWRKCDALDDLRSISELVVDDSLHYSPAMARWNFVQILTNMPAGGWWSMSGFSASVEQFYPNFLHSTGKEENWLIRNSQAAALTECSAAWLRIEDPYMRYMLGGPLNWLGICDVAWASEADMRISAFRITRSGRLLLREMLQEDIPAQVRSEKQSAIKIPAVSVDGRITLTRGVSRYFSYQAARFCEWEKIEAERCVLRITPASLERAQKNGLMVGSFVAYMRRTCGAALPGRLVTAIARWEKENVQAVMTRATILSVQRKEIIDLLLQDRDGVKWIIQRLNDTTVVIKRKGEDAVRRILAENEILCRFDEKQGRTDDGE